MVEKWMIKRKMNVVVDVIWKWGLGWEMWWGWILVVNIIRWNCFNF